MWISNSGFAIKGIRAAELKSTCLALEPCSIYCWQEAWLSILTAKITKKLPRRILRVLRIKCEVIQSTTHILKSDHKTSLISQFLNIHLVHSSSLIIFTIIITQISWVHFIWDPQSCFVSPPSSWPVPDSQVSFMFPRQLGLLFQ